MDAETIGEIVAGIAAFGGVVYGIYGIYNSHNCHTVKGEVLSVQYGNSQVEITLRLENKISGKENEEGITTRLGEETVTNRPGEETVTLVAPMSQKVMIYDKGEKGYKESLVDPAADIEHLLGCIRTGYDLRARTIQPKGKLRDVKGVIELYR